jgi:hypothetical protein
VKGRDWMMYAAVPSKTKGRLRYRREYTRSATDVLRDILTAHLVGNIPIQMSGYACWRWRKVTSRHDDNRLAGGLGDEDLKPGHQMPSSVNHLFSTHIVLIH